MTKVDGQIYLATPYSHPDKGVRELRYQTASLLVAGLLRQGQAAFSPIVYLHQVAIEHSLPQHSSWYREMNYTWMKASAVVWFAPLDGFETSTGWKEEMTWCIEQGHPYRELSSDEVGELLDLR